MSTILVTGGTSGPGRPLVEKLRSAGHDVRVLSRSPGEGRVVGDLDANTGLDAAVAGTTVVVHLATNRKRDLPGTENLLAAAKKAGVRHLVYISIVGVDRIPYAYYRDKVANEEAIAASGVPFTILRATQFHSFPGDLLKLTGGRLFVNLPIQPIGVDDVAARLAEARDRHTCGAGRRHRRTRDSAGPRRPGSPATRRTRKEAGVLALAARQDIRRIPGRSPPQRAAGLRHADVRRVARGGSAAMTLTLRLGLAVLAFAQLVVGGWNLVAPEHFYANFPGVALTPPFAEHYARDFGGTMLGLGVILSVAVVLPRTVLVVPALVGLAVFVLPHAYFHVEHLHDASPFVTAFTLVAVLGQSVLTVAMLALALVRWHRSRDKTEAGSEGAAS